jgi:DNA-binding Lrp family transcriptional regulator
MERLPMRKIKDVLRLRAAGYSARRIADSLGLGRTSARNYLERAEKAGLSWPDVAGLDEDALEHRLFGREARPGVCQTSCPPISCSVSDFRGADIGFWIEPDGSSRLPVSGFA